MRAETAKYVHDEIWHSIKFFKEMDTRENKTTQNFLAWMCMHLKRDLVAEENDVFHENDLCREIYFLMEGDVYFILSAKQDKFKYIQVDEGEYFGMIDIFSSLVLNDLIPADGWQFENWNRYADKLTRQFTVAANKTQA